MNFKRQGPLYVPEHEPIRRYDREDQRRWAKHVEWRKRQPIPRCAIAFVRKTDGLSTASATSVTFNLSGTASAGNFLGLSIRIGTSGRTLTVTDDVGDTALKALAQAISGGNPELNIYYFENCGAATSVTIAISGAAARIDATVHEYSGLATSSSLDKTASAADASGTSTAPNSGATATTTQNDELVFGADISGSLRTHTVGAGFSNGAQSPTGANAGLCAGEGMVVAATGAQTATFTFPTGATWACGVATFKAAAAAGRTTKNTRGFTLGTEVGMNWRSGL